MDTTAESILTRDEMESRRLLAAQDLSLIHISITAQGILTRDEMESRRLLAAQDLSLIHI